MIPLIQKTLQGEYDFLKYSTPNSGANREDKVIFLAFPQGSGMPSRCIKTVRTYEAKEVIHKGFKNLQKLNALTKDSAYERLFPQALGLYDDGEQIFSIEEAAQGRRERLTPAMLGELLETYTGFQAHIAHGPLRSADQFAQELLPPELYAHYQKLPHADLQLPRVLQLGDLTEDNVLVSAQGPQVVDFDHVGLVELPGFDLFALLRRLDPRRARARWEEVLPTYLSAIGAQGGGPYDRLLFLCVAAERTLRKPHTTALLDDDIKKYFSEAI